MDFSGIQLLTLLYLWNRLFFVFRETNILLHVMSLYFNFCFSIFLFIQSTTQSTFVWTLITQPYVIYNCF